MTASIPASISALVPWPVWLTALGAAVALVLSLAVAAGRATRSIRAALATAAILGAWLAAVVALSAAGVFRGAATSPPRIGPAVALPVIAGAAALALSAHARAFAARIPQPWLVGVQALRVLGVVFLLLEARGVLPAHFARPAGLGDFAVGLAAPFVARALARDLRGARAAAVAWNLLGVIDLVAAVGIGALTARSSIQVFHSIPSTDAMAVLPLSLIPAFAVPIFLLLHLASLLGLRRAAATGPDPARRPAAARA